MSISAKRRRKIIVGNKTYFWYGALDDDEAQYGNFKFIGVAGYIGLQRKKKVKEYHGT